MAGFLLAVAAPAQAATLHVSPGGSDSSSCSAGSPCKSFARAYAAAASGDVVSVGSGAHGVQQVPAGSKALTFRGAPGAEVHELDNYAGNVTFDGIEVDAGFTKEAAFESHGVDDVTFKNARIGNVTDEKGAVVSGARFTFDNVDFHDVIATNSSIHNECVYAIVVPSMTVRNSSFRDCATMDLFFTYGDWWNPLPPAYGGVTLENNVFGHPEMSNGQGWHYYSLYVAHTGPPSQSWGSMSGWTVRNNTFETGAFLDSSGGTNGTRWVGNLGDWNCLPGVTFRYNVGHRCNATDKAVSPARSSASGTAALGWLNPTAFDFHLTSSSPAIDAADPSDHPATDHDGKRRPVGSAPDAGAFEYGTATSPPSPPPPPPTPSDRDGDGVPDSRDECPDSAGTQANGCPAAPAAGPIGAWSFNETSGSRAADTSGHGNHGMISGATYDEGRYGNALSFDGVDDYVSVADAPSLELGAAMTIEAWVKPETVSGYRSVLFKENRAAGHQSYSLYAANGNASPTAEVATGPRYTTLASPQDIAANVWTHVAATYDGSTLRIFQNGVEVARAPLSGNLLNTSDPLKFGGNAVWGEWFKGLIDEVRIWNQPRSAAQIQTDMRSPI